MLISSLFCCELLERFEKPAIAAAFPSGIVHGFAGVIGGMFPAPHGSVCAALLVPGTRMNLKVTAPRGSITLHCLCFPTQRRITHIKTLPSIIPKSQPGCGAPAAILA